MLQLLKIKRIILISEATKSHTILKGKHSSLLSRAGSFFFKKSNYMLLEMMSKTGIQKTE